MMSKDKPLNIVFMGTPTFAVGSLKALADAGFHISAVITSPDKPAGRGMKIHMSEVKQFAQERSMPVLQPTNLKSPEFIQQLTDIGADLQIVVAFRMLPEVVWNMPPLGTINLHASLLPQYRGAAPINHAIINGEKETGVTTFKLRHEIDTGNILLQEKVAIKDADNAGTLHDKLMHTGADLLVKTIRGLQEGTLKEVGQESVSASIPLKPAPKIHREDCEIHWNNSVADIHNFVRGLTPHPGAFTFLQGKRIHITQTDKEQAVAGKETGTYVTDGKSFLKFTAEDGFIRVLRLKPEGKREMSIEDFLRGQRDL